MKTKLNSERLWITSTGTIVCERAECAPAPLLEQIAKAKRQMNQFTGPRRERYSVLNETDLAEFGALLQAQHELLTCKCGAVRYMPDSHTLQTRTSVETGQEGTGS